MNRMRWPSSSTMRASRAGARPTTRPTPAAASVTEMVGCACAAAASRKSRLSGGARARVHARAHGGTPARERLARLDRDVRPLQHANDLERVEGVSTRGLMHLGEEGTRKQDSEVLLHDRCRAPTSSGPTSTFVHRSVGRERRSSASSELSRPDRRERSTPTCSSRSRRAAYPSAPEEAESSHCTSSTETRSDRASASARSAFSSATPTACGSGVGPSSSSSTSARESARLCPAGRGARLRRGPNRGGRRHRQS